MPRIADIVRQFGPAYLARYETEMLPSHRRALRDLGACRTAAFGGHVTACDHCGTEHYVYHSCRNRSCPQCHGAATARWLAAREAELLPVPYFHVVFTLPSELRALVRTHQRVLLAALMTTATESLQALAADPHYVGGTLGILAVLHTWTRALIYHPHVHCLVPGGALAWTTDGTATWRPARSDFLVPVRALSARFRARFLARLRAALPNVIVPAAVWRKPWVVYCKPTVQGSAPVLQYLARYVHRVAITDARILTIEGDQVRFAYKGAREGRDPQTTTWRTMTLGGEEFLRRFLQHVLPRGFHKVRYYGFWRPKATELRAQLQQHLGAPSSITGASASSLRDTPDRSADENPLPATLPRCSACGVGHIRVVRRLLRTGTSPYLPVGQPGSSRAVAPSGIPP